MVKNKGKSGSMTNIRSCIKDLRFSGAHNCGSGGRWFESTQLYQIRRLKIEPGAWRLPDPQFSANQNLATNVALHQLDSRPRGLDSGSMCPPGIAFGSPVRTKQLALDRLASK